MPLLVAEPIQVRPNQRAARRQRVPIRTIVVAGHEELVCIHQRRDIPIGVGVIIGVGRYVASNQLPVISPCQQPANAAWFLQTAAQIVAARVSHQGQIVAIPLL